MLKRPNMCYIFKKQEEVHGFQIWHSDWSMFLVNQTGPRIYQSFAQFTMSYWIYCLLQTRATWEGLFWSIQSYRCRRPLLLFGDEPAGTIIRLLFWFVSDSVFVKLKYSNINKYLDSIKCCLHVCAHNIDINVQSQLAFPASWLVAVVAALAAVADDPTPPGGVKVEDKDECINGGNHSNLWHERFCHELELGFHFRRSNAMQWSYSS